jgi:hypothetical protein
MRASDRRANKVPAEYEAKAIKVDEASGAPSSSVRQEAIVRLLDLARLNELLMRPSFDYPKGH